MAGDVVDAELRAWVVDEARRGSDPDQVVAALVLRGWGPESAVDAVQRALDDYLAEHAAATGMPPPVPVPEPMERGGPHLIDVGDREVPVLANLLHPRVVVLGNLLSAEECDQLIELSRSRLARSETFLLDEGVNSVHQARTSEGTFLARGENELCQRIEQRIARLCQWPVENGEGLQILRYGPGAEYVPHYDYFDPSKPGTRAVLARGGQRVASLVIYLNTPGRGGATVFPEAKFDVSPIKGNAVFFSYNRPHPITGSLHGGAPVIEGEKWIATKWLRSGVFT